MSDELDALFDTGLPIHDDDLGPEADVVQRDRWGRPLIDGQPFTRASTLSNMLTDHTGITVWEKRLLVLGMGRDFRLVERASALPDIYDTSQNKALLTKEQIAEDQQTKYALDDIGVEAMNVAGRMTKAWYGTAFHGHTDPDVSGNKQVPPSMQADVDAYRHETVAIEQLASEKFMVNRELRIAGTPDGFYRVPGVGVVVGDKKTGIFEPTDWIVQMAAYARSEFFVPISGLKKPAELWHDYNPDIGIVFHSPRHAGQTTMYLVNLDVGWRGTQVAATVRDWRQQVKKKDVATILTRDRSLVDTRQALHDTLAGMTNRDDMVQLFRDNRSIWTPELDEAAKSRLDEIGAKD